MSKRKLVFKPTNSTPKYNTKVVSAIPNKNYTPNLFSKQATGNKSKEANISRRFISLIDEEEKQLVSKVKVAKKQNNVTTNRYSDFSKQLSKLETISKLKIHSANSSHFNADQEWDIAEENMVESPCPRPRAPAIKSYRKADEKSADHFEFKISPWLITECDISKSKSNNSSPEESLFQGEDIIEDGDYELFTWWDDFTDIVNSESSNIHQINLQEISEIDCRRKYTLLKEYMKFKSSLIRHVQARLVRDRYEEDNSDYKSKETHKKRRSVAYTNFKLEDQMNKSMKNVNIVRDNTIVFESDTIINTENDHLERTMKSPSRYLLNIRNKLTILRYSQAISNEKVTIFSPFNYN